MHYRDESVLPPPSPSGAIRSPSRRSRQSAAPLLYLTPHRRDGRGRGTGAEFFAMTYRPNGYANNSTLSHRGCATSDVTPSSHLSDEYLSELHRQECSDMLSSLLATAAVALNTNRRVTQRCIERAAVLLGINLSPGVDKTAGSSCLQRGLASWQAKRVTSYIEDKLDSTIRVSDLAGLVRLSSSHFSRAFRETWRDPFHLRHEAPHGASSATYVDVTRTPLASGLGMRHVRSATFLADFSPNRRNQSRDLAASIHSEYLRVS